MKAERGHFNVNDTIRRLAGDQFDESHTHGDLATFERLLAENPELAATQIEDRKGGYRSLLHIAADWPGHFPNGGAIVHCLLKAGADVEGGVHGKGETPLHWAASSDDRRL